MPQYGYIIGSEDGVVSQFNNEDGSFVRRLCQLNPDWSASTSDFDTVTGLPNADALGATDTSVPCSIASSSQLAYLYDTYTARVLALDPETGAVFTQFGGCRGIGAGKIALDGTPRSVCNVANGKFFLTDNAGGFVVQYDLFGAFEAEYSIADWASALSIAFDQVTGWTYDNARGVYWALAQSATAAYLFAVGTDGVATGTVIDLTSRLSTTLSITVGGHDNSPAERVRTRGLYANNGRVFLWSQGYLIRVDLANTDGDLLLIDAVNDLSPGNVNADGDRLIYVLRDQPNNEPVAYVIDGEGTELLSYGSSFSPADGEDGHIAEPWDATVSPTEEGPARISRGISLRARITAVASQTIQMRAAIQKSITVTQQLRARILNLGPFGAQVSMLLRARIEEPSTFPDQFVKSWTLSDNLGQFSRQLQMEATGRAGFQVGDTLTLYAGYGTDRVKLFEGEVDEIEQDLSTDEERWSFLVNDRGARRVASRKITLSPAIQFPGTTTDIPSVTSNAIRQEFATAGGASFANSAAPDYPLYSNFAAFNENALQVAQRLSEPFGQFPHQSYFHRVRDDGLLTTVVNWLNVPDTGYVVRRGRLKTVRRRQTSYVQSPDLRGQELRVKGVNVSYAIIDQIGPQTRVEYFRTLSEASVTEQSSANTGTTPFARAYVLTEHFSVEETWGDKVLSRTAETLATPYSATGGATGPTRLVAREEETTLYMEPPGGLGFSSIQTSSAGPSPLAIPYQTNSIVSGIDPSDGTFKEQQRTQTEFYYDQRFQLAAETTSVNTFNSSTQQWELDSVQHRPISETTGGSSRIRRISFSNADGVLSFDGSDTQQVGGGRPDPAQITGNAAVVTFQAMAPEPQVEFDIFNQAIVVDPGNTPVWMYENGWLGQNECEAVLGLARVEQSLQVGGYKWEEVSFTGVLDPNLQAGMPIALEVAEGVFVDYWLESVSHSFDTGEALTKGSAKRITQDDLP